MNETTFPLSNLAVVEIGAERAGFLDVMRDKSTRVTEHESGGRDAKRPARRSGATSKDKSGDVIRLFL